MIRTGLAFWTLLLLSGLSCAPLEDLPRGVCGNAIVEPSLGEDCDSFVEGDLACGQPEESISRACHYLCDGDGRCPGGYGCGFDGVCRRPDLVSGFTFGAGASFSEELSGRVQLGDVDGDGVLDLVGFSKTSVIARFGAGDGSFPAEAREILSLGVPISINVEPQVGDINGDRTADIVAPHTQGVQVLAGIPGGRGFTPVPFPQIVLDHAEPGGSRIVGVEAGPGEFHAFVALLPVEGVPCVALIDPFRPAPVACGQSQRLSGELPMNLPRQLLVIDLDGDGASEVLLSFPGSNTIYLFSVLPPPSLGGPPSLQRAGDITLGGELHSTGRLFIDDVNGDGLRDLIVEATRQNGSHAIAVAKGLLPAPGPRGAAGRFEDTARVDQRRSRVFDRFANPEQTAVLAYTDLTSDGLPDAVVTGALRTGVQGENALGSFVFVAITATVAGDGFDARYAALDTIWSEVLPEDVNRDGIVDLTVVSAEQQGFDVLVGNGISFNSKHYESGGFVRELLVADFDGDLTPDVGVSTSGQLGAGSEFFVSFGRPLAFPADATDLGDFGFIEAIGAAYTRGTPIDLVADVAIVSFQPASGSTDNNRLIYVLNGSTDRRPRAPRGLTPPSLAPAEVGGRSTRAPANSVFTGYFDPNRPRVPGGLDAPDLLEIFATGSEVRSGPIAQVSLVPGGEQFLTAAPHESTEACDQPARIHCSYGISGRVAGSDNDALIFAGPAAPCDAKDTPPPTTVPYLTVLRWDANLGRPVCSSSDIPGVDEGRVKRVESGEFGSGHGNDLLVGLATPSGPRVVVIWDFGIASAINGRVIHVARLAPRPSFNDTSPLLDARAADLDLDGRPDVVLRTRQNILWAKGSAEGFDLIEPLIQDPTGADSPGVIGLPAPDLLPSGGLAIADLDGNGLPDLLLHSGAGFVSFLRNVVGAASPEVTR